MTVYGFAEKAIRFGTSKAAVPRQRMFKQANGEPLRVDDDGYLTADRPGMIFTIQ